MYEIQETVEGS